jgi:hypothetical protein
MLSKSKGRCAASPCTSPASASTAKSTGTSELLRIPQAFFHDYADRFTGAAPYVVRATKRYFWIRANDPHLPALISNAEAYADKAYQDNDFGARALLRALGKYPRE